MIKNKVLILFFICIPFGIGAQTASDSLELNHEVLINLDTISAPVMDEGTNDPLLNGYIYAGGINENVYYMRNDSIEIFYIKRED